MLCNSWKIRRYCIPVVICAMSSMLAKRFFLVLIKNVLPILNALASVTHLKSNSTMNGNYDVLFANTYSFK